MLTSRENSQPIQTEEQKKILLTGFLFAALSAGIHLIQAEMMIKLGGIALLSLAIVACLPLERFQTVQASFGRIAGLYTVALIALYFIIGFVSGFPNQLGLVAKLAEVVFFLMLVLNEFKMRKKVVNGVIYKEIPRYQRYRQEPVVRR